MLAALHQSLPQWGDQAAAPVQPAHTPPNAFSLVLPRKAEGHERDARRR